MEAKEHVEEIRGMMVSIGGDPNLFTKTVHHATESVSTELYRQDADVLMELIKNADDNEYPKGVDPSLEFVITSKDITNTGAPATLLVFNNDKGFLPKDIESICSVERSTKKGTGFRSVFLIADEPHIFSNGYRIMFDKRPCKHCNISVIVPEWVESTTLFAIQMVYGSAALPTTTLVLPLKPDKVKAVKDKLSSIQLLFLSNIKQLSVREIKDNVSAISVSIDKDFITPKSMYAVSYTVHLVNRHGGHREYPYHMWEQRFHVKHENRVDVRMEVKEWVITLAFPIEERSKLNSLPGIYSFSPTEIVTNFPFIIQSDFLLDSSRKNILWGNKWNQGILDCVPDAFVNAFTALVEYTKRKCKYNLPNMFRFLPVNESSHPILNHVRGAIKAKLMTEIFVPCESYTGKKLYRKPTEVGWVEPAFWSILKKARSQALNYSNVSSHGAFLLDTSFDTNEYTPIRRFLEIQPLGCEWYAQCIGSSILVMGVSEDVYIQLLVFIAETWSFWSDRTSIKNTPLIKYVGWDGKVKLLTLGSCKDKLLAAESGTGSDCLLWLLNWNKEFHCPNGGGNREFQCSKGRAFLPKVTQEAIRSCSKKPMLVKWLEEVVDIKFVSVYKYAEFLSVSVEFDPKLAVTYARFLHTSYNMDYLLRHEVQSLCSKMPIVDNCRRVNVRTCSALVPSVAHTCKRTGITESRNHRLFDTAGPVLTSSKEVMEKGKILVPAKGSRWKELFGTNPWRHENYVELGEDYTCTVHYFGGVISGKDLVLFLKTYAKVSDVPHLSPPNAAIPTLSAPLTKRNTFFLLDWINNLKTSWVSLPESFSASIKSNSWLRVSLNGSLGYRPPSESFMLDSFIGKFLQDETLPFVIPLLDEKFYGVKIRERKVALETIGVRTRDSEACEYIATHLMFLAASLTLTRHHVLWILEFIEFLGKNHISSGKFIDFVKGEKWVKTSQGYMAPSGSVLFSQKWNAASEISDIPFIDHKFYGEELLSFKKQLRLTGVVVDFNNSYHQLVLDKLKTPSSLTCLSSEALLLLLRCIEHLPSSDKLVQAIKNTKCLKTYMGYRCPYECFLLNPGSDWGCLPVLDEKFYGSTIFSMANELKKIGVLVDFENACKELTYLSSIKLYYLPSPQYMPSQFSSVIEI